MKGAIAPALSTGVIFDWFMGVLVMCFAFTPFINLSWANFTATRQTASFSAFAVITGVALDHEAILGTTLDAKYMAERVVVKAGRSRFTLSSLPAAEFPLVEEINAQQTLSVAQGEFRRLIDKTHFSMAQQDIRYYLNGVLFSIDKDVLRVVDIARERAQ